jgi:hypothetical protein
MGPLRRIRLVRSLVAYHVAIYVLIQYDSGELEESAGDDALVSAALTWTVRYFGVAPPCLDLRHGDPRKPLGSAAFEV